MNDTHSFQKPNKQGRDGIKGGGAIRPPAQKDRPVFGADGLWRGFLAYPWEAVIRRQLFKRNLGRCFSAVDDRGHPRAATAMLGACPVSSWASLTPGWCLHPFADPIIFLFIGGFIIARAMTLHHLDRRFALAILRFAALAGARQDSGRFWPGNCRCFDVDIQLGGHRYDDAYCFGDTPRHPGDEQAGRWTIRDIQELMETPFAAGLLLMTAFAASVGGIGTPIGTPPNLIGIGLINRLLGVDINFFQWMSLGVPLCVAMYGVLLRPLSAA